MHLTVNDLLLLFITSPSEAIEYATHVLYSRGSSLVGSIFQSITFRVCCKQQQRCNVGLGEGERGREEKSFRTCCQLTLIIGGERERADRGGGGWMSNCYVRGVCIEIPAIALKVEGGSGECGCAAPHCISKMPQSV